MADIDPNKTESQEQPSYTPASVEKRIAAWMGIIYALMFGFIITFSLYCPGRSLKGTFPLFLVPIAVAAAIITIYRQAKGTAPGGLPLTIIITVICLLAAAVGLFLGIPPLAAAFVG